MEKHSIIGKNIQDSILLKQQVLADKTLMRQVDEMVTAVVGCFKNGGKVLFCGNGGSAADAQHLAAELSGRYYYDRPPLFSEALHVNSSYVTAVANDYSFEHIYARMIKAMGQKNDILIGMSTSGNSSNVIEGLKQAKEQGMLTIGMTGGAGGAMNEVCDIVFIVPSTDTPRIQEMHMLIGHTICEIVEMELFPRN
ncbi:MAG: D-sedoheptulose 7-phosphate isomerase [Candidatus Azotimanducaceae bacterium]|jgi:D-sedoheptulose 7-phosphate isomerase